MLFRRKKKIQTLTLTDASGNALFTGPAADYVLPEPVLLELSVAYFNDPEPCEIHRGAVHKRVLMELMECCRGNTVPVSALTDTQKTYFPENTAFVRVAEEEQ